MNSSIKLGQGLAWAAWLVFILSLFLPMETNNLSGPCAWPCGQPFTDYGWQNASFYALSIIVFMLNFVQVIFSSIFDLQTLGRVLDSLITMGIYAVIGLGQFLIVLAPVWPVRIKKASWRRLHLWVIILSALAALAYSMFPTLRLGVEVLSGYYLWVLSFFLLVVASILVQHRKNPDFGTEEGQ